MRGPPDQVARLRLQTRQTSSDIVVTPRLSASALMACTCSYCATVPQQICRRLAQDALFKVLPTPVDLGRFPMHMAWQVRYRQDPAHLWLRKLVAEVAGAL